MTATPNEFSNDESTSAANGPSEPTELSESERHGLLASARRRVLLDVLRERTAPVDVRELAADIAEREGDGPTSTRTERVAATLHHSHLPRMSDLGLLDHDPERNRVEAIRVDDLL